MNECLAGSINDCHEHADCSNTLGSYTCACSHYYTGDGYTNCTSMWLSACHSLTHSWSGSG